MGPRRQRRCCCPDTPARSDFALRRAAYQRVRAGNGPQRQFRTKAASCCRQRRQRSDLRRRRAAARPGPVATLPGHSSAQRPAGPRGRSSSAGAAPTRSTRSPKPRERPPGGPSAPRQCHPSRARCPPSSLTSPGPAVGIEPRVSLVDGMRSAWADFAPSAAGQGPDDARR